MIKIKLEKNKSGKIIFKLKVVEIDRNNILLKRVFMEGKVIKGNIRFNYEVLLRFFIFICKNVDKIKFNLDNKSLLFYLEFFDYYDENYYIEVEVIFKYMKKWREEGCLDIYRIIIDKEIYDIKKEVVFKKLSILFGKFKL